jgi:hypothetical protein
MANGIKISNPVRGDKTKKAGEGDHVGSGVVGTAMEMPVRRLHDAGVFSLGERERVTVALW